MKLAMLAGRCVSDAQRDHGRLIHAVEMLSEPWYGRALCGAEPGRRSYGWSELGEREVQRMAPDGLPTCPRCAQRWVRIGVRA